MSECVKCGSTEEAAYQYREAACFIDGNFPERMRRTCRRCGYFWNEPCKDAEVFGAIERGKITEDKIVEAKP